MSYEVIFNRPKMEEALRLLRGLTHPTRVKIIKLLLQNGELKDQDLYEAFPNFNKAQLNKHLSVLSSFKVLEREQHNDTTCYVSDVEKLDKIMTLIDDFSRRELD